MGGGVKDRPILFSEPMVLAIIAGRKTMTRRIVKYRITGPNPPGRTFDWHHPKTNAWLAAHGDGFEFSKTGAARLCPYGQPGDRLWVREPWRTYKSLDHVAPKNIGIGAAIHYECGGNLLDNAAVHSLGKLRSSIHMPRWFSRIQLEITGRHVEWLQDISAEDALAEGIERTVAPFSIEPYRNYAYPRMASGHNKSTPEASFSSLWESINGPGSWATNPWVWVVEFKKVDAHA